MFSSNIYSKLQTQWKSFRIPAFLFWTTVLFYGVLWLISPGNKLIFVFAVCLAGIYWLKLKDLSASLLLTSLATSIIAVGKQYDFILVPPGIFSLDYWPNGYVDTIYFTPYLAVSFLLIVPLIQNAVQTKWNNMRFETYDWWLLLFFFWTIISSLFASTRPEISMFYPLLLLPTIFVYLSLRLYPKKKVLFQYAISIFCALIVAESFLSFHQFIVGSPTGKSMEVQGNIDLFGEASDEIPFRYRPTGTYIHANALAQKVVVFVMFVFPSLLSKSDAIQSVSIMLGFLTLLLTLSRSAWLGLGVAGAWAMNRLHTGFAQVRGLVRYLPVLLLFGIFIVLPRLQASLNVFSDSGGGYIRDQQIKDVFTLIITHPFLGVGANMSVPEMLLADPTGIFKDFPTPVHNAVVLMMAEQGIPAVILFVVFVLSTLKRIRRERGFRLQFISATTSIVALGFVAFFQPYNFESTAIIVLALCLPYESHKIGTYSS